MNKISPKSLTKWSHLSNFHLGVSVGSRLQSGDYLLSIIEWLNSAGFKQGMVDISDTLNRYNYMIEGATVEEAWSLAKKDGQEWYAKNCYVLEKLNMPCQFVHWDYWLSHPNFSEYLSMFQKAFHEDVAFRLSVMKDIQHHYQRRFNQDLHERSERDIEFSKNFYLEELAVLTIQFENYPCAEIYPGRELECVKRVRSGNVKNVPNALRNAIHAKLHINEEAFM